MSLAYSFVSCCVLILSPKCFSFSLSASFLLPSFLKFSRSVRLSSYILSLISVQGKSSYMSENSKILKMRPNGRNCQSDKHFLFLYFLIVTCLCFSLLFVSVFLSLCFVPVNASYIFFVFLCVLLMSADLKFRFYALFLLSHLVLFASLSFSPVIKRWGFFFLHFIPLLLMYNYIWFLYFWFCQCTRHFLVCTLLPFYRCPRHAPDICFQSHWT